MRLFLHLFFLFNFFFASAWAQEPVLEEDLTNHAGGIAYQQKCSACHTIGEGNRVGPDLLNVHQAREEQWLIRWIVEPDKMIKEKDPIAMKLLKEFNQVPMPNLGVTDAEAKSILDYITKKSETASTGSKAVDATDDISSASLSEWSKTVQFKAFAIFIFITLIIVIAFWLIMRSTRNPVSTIDTKSAYALRRKLIIGTSILVLGMLGATLPFNPYPNSLAIPDHVVFVASNQFSFIFSSEPITTSEEIPKVQAIGKLEVAVNELIEFRVTSLDATHGFGIYDEYNNILAQTQAMPGYVNRLRVKFTKPGHYNVLCLEYCGLGHHLMRTSFTVK